MAAPRRPGAASGGGLGRAPGLLGEVREPIEVRMLGVGRAVGATTWSIMRWTAIPANPIDSPTADGCPVRCHVPAYGRPRSPATGSGGLRGPASRFEDRKGFASTKGRISFRCRNGRGLKPAMPASSASGKSSFSRRHRMRLARRRARPRRFYFARGAGWYRWDERAWVQLVRPHGWTGGHTGVRDAAAEFGRT